MGALDFLSASGRADGLVRITLKKGDTDGAIAVDMDPLSQLCRLTTSVPPPRFHIVRYAAGYPPAVGGSPPVLSSSTGPAL
jgi:hypothetical protein